ncbi:hypothetical protein [Silvibacterium acidisoli]|uniref:hypothetical protein n=1 Tax=Acidobacteriaceae bacterium ZG23-2 TaxID=2883246 RepID=UPI00406D28D4
MLNVIHLIENVARDAGAGVLYETLPVDELAQWMVQLLANLSYQIEQLLGIGIEIE